MMQRRYESPGIYAGTKRWGECCLRNLKKGVCDVTRYFTQRAKGELCSAKQGQYTIALGAPAVLAGSLTKARSCGSREHKGMGVWIVENAGRSDSGSSPYCLSLRPAGPSHNTLPKICT